MNYQYQREKLPQQEGFKYTLLNEGQVLQVHEVLQLWQKSEAFNIFYNQLLCDCEYAAFFWEHPPQKIYTLNQAYEFVLTNSSSLNGIQANYRPFQKYLDQAHLASHFYNLGKDAMLVVPSRHASATDYASMATFVRTAPIIQQQAFWKLVGQTYQQELNTQWKWLSTSGLGVYWLHARIDTFPKYYVYKLYKSSYNE